MSAPSVASTSALGRLSLEDRALVLTACGLAGRGAPALLRLLASASREAALQAALDALLAEPLRERLSRLALGLRRLASPPPPDARALHPERLAALTAWAAATPGALGEGCLRALGVQAGPGTDSLAAPRPRAVHPAVVVAVESWLRARVAPAPSAEALQVTPPPLRKLASTTPAVLARVAERLGAPRLRALLEAAPAEVACWLRQRLAPAWDERLAETSAAPVDEAMASLVLLAGGAPVSR